MNLFFELLDLEKAFDRVAVVDLEKADDRVPRDVAWWALRKLGVEELLVKIVQSMYRNTRRRVRVFQLGLSVMISWSR